MKNQHNRKKKKKKKRLLIPNAGGQDSIPSQGTGSYMFQLRKISFVSQLRPGAAKKRKQARKKKRAVLSSPTRFLQMLVHALGSPVLPLPARLNSSSAAWWRCFVIVEKSPSSKVLSRYQLLSSQNFSEFNYLFVGCPH